MNIYVASCKAIAQSFTEANRVSRSLMWRNHKLCETLSNSARLCVILNVLRHYPKQVKCQIALDSHDTSPKRCYLSLTKRNLDGVSTQAAYQEKPDTPFTHFCNCPVSTQAAYQEK